MKKLLIITFICIIGLGLVIWLSSSKSNKTSIITGLPTPTHPPSLNIPADWQTYNNEALSYTISYPGSYALESNGENSIMLIKPSTQPGQGPTNFIYVSVVTKDQLESEGTAYNYNPIDFKKLQELEVGKSVVLGNSDQAEWFTYTQVNTTEIASQQARVYENNKPWEFPQGTTETRYIFETDGKIYLLGYYAGGGVEPVIDPREAFQIIQSLQLTR